MPADFQTGVFVKEPAWHGLGIVIPEPMLPSDAVMMAGLDYNFYLADIVAKLMIGEGNPVEFSASNNKMIVREPIADDPRWRDIGTVGPGYQIIQNLEIAKLIDPLSEVYPLETMGALNVGNRVGAQFFITLDMGKLEFNGDLFQVYAFIAEDRVNGALRWFVTFVRVVCKNTWMAGIRSSIDMQRITHRSDMHEQLKIRTELEKNMVAERERIQNQFQHMLDYSLNKETFADFLEASYPDPEKPARVQMTEQLVRVNDGGGNVDADVLRSAQTSYITLLTSWERHRERIKQARIGTAQAYNKFNDEFPQSAESLYAANNALIEYEDHHRRKRNAGRASLFGAGARVKERAYDYSIKMMQN